MANIVSLLRIGGVKRYFRQGSALTLISPVRDNN